MTATLCKYRAQVPSSLQACVEAVLANDATTLASVAGACTSTPVHSVTSTHRGQGKHSRCATNDQPAGGAAATLPARRRARGVQAPSSAAVRGVGPVLCVAPACTAGLSCK